MMKMMKKLYQKNISGKELSNKTGREIFESQGQIFLNLNDMLQLKNIKYRQGNHMTTYKETTMVLPEHIKEIDKQLKKLGSKVEERFLDGEEHVLANVLNLACGSGTFGISSLDVLNSIGDVTFSIECKKFYHKK